MIPPRDHFYPLQVQENPPGPSRNAVAFTELRTPEPAVCPEGSVFPERHERVPAAEATGPEPLSTPAERRCAESERRPALWRVPPAATVCRTVNVSTSDPRWTQVVEAATNFFGRDGRPVRRGAAYLWISRGWIITSYVWLIPDRHRSRLHLCSEWQDLFPLLGLSSLLTAFAFAFLLDTVLTPTDPTAWLLAALGLAMLFAGGYFGFRAWIRHQQRRLTRLADHLAALLTDHPSDV